MQRSAISFYGYQQRWFLDRSRFKIGMFARQTGKTFTTTSEVVDDCFEQVMARDGRRARWVILSRGERQAKEAMDAGVKLHARAYGMAIDEAGYEWKAESGAVYNALDVTLPGGSKITALPANPDTARGFSANVFLDEFAFHRDSRQIWGALFPVISAGWKLRITSTPNGKDNKFYEIMTGDDEIWSRHSVDIYQAVADGLPRDIAMLRQALGDEDLWAQEFELKWLDEASAWLPYDLINAVEEEGLGAPSGYQGGICYVGRDIGRRNDLHVIQVFEDIGGILFDRERIEQKRATFAEMDDAFDDVMRRYRVARACVDQTGMGEPVLETAQRRWGEMVVEGVIFTSSSKLTMATAGKQRFEDRTLRLRAGDQALRADLHKLRKIAGPTGVPRFVAERDDDHADRTWAIFLAVNAAGSDAGPLYYAPAAGAERGGVLDGWDDAPARTGFYG